MDNSNSRRISPERRMEATIRMVQRNQTGKVCLRFQGIQGFLVKGFMSLKTPTAKGDLLRIDLEQDDLQK